MRTEALKSLIDQYGLQKYRDALVATARPAILMNLATEGAGEVGQSHVGGIPDLPPSLGWPRPTNSSQYLGFVLQLNFAELPDFPDNPLPRAGMLYLFAGDDDAPRQIMIYQGDEPLQPMPAPDDATCVVDYLEDIVPYQLTFEAIADIPRWATSDFAELAEAIGADSEDSENEDALNDLGSALSGNCVGKLLGHVAGIGHDPREDAFVVREIDSDTLYDYERRATLDLTGARRWHNLLQVDTTNAIHLMFGDAGFLHVLIHEDDLTRQDFSRVYISEESS